MEVTRIMKFALLFGLGLLVSEVTRIRAAGFLFANGTPDPLEVSWQRVEVQIVDQVVITRIRQTFRNHTDRVLEGEYRFTLSPGASVSDFAIWEDDQRVAGVIRRKEDARQIYEHIVNQNRDPGLLEQVAPTVFKARVYPILARSEKRIEIEYREMLPLDEGLCMARVPLLDESLVSPRIGELVVTFEVKDGGRILTAWSPESDLAIHHRNEHEVSASYEGRNVQPVRDLILHYQVVRPEKGFHLVSHRTAGEDGYFLLTLNPDDPGMPRREKDVVFVMDVSGSMKGLRMEKAKQALKFCLTLLEPQDRFDLVRFSTEVGRLGSGKGLIAATDAEIDRALTWVDELEARGGTNLEGGMRDGLGLLRDGPPERPRYLVVLSDGDPTIGVTHFEEIEMSVLAENRTAARIFTFGIGEVAGSRLLATLSANHRGEALAIRQDDDLESRLPLFFGKLVRPLFDKVEIDWGGLAVEQIYPREVPPFYLGRAVSVAGRFRQAGSGLVKIRAQVEGRTVDLADEIVLPETAEAAFLPRFWAQRHVTELIDMSPKTGVAAEVEDEIVRLSTEHVFVTPFTSFIAVPEKEKLRLPEELRKKLEGETPPSPSPVVPPSTPEEAKAAYIEGKRLYDEGRDLLERGDPSYEERLTRAIERFEVARAGNYKPESVNYFLGSAYLNRGIDAKGDLSRAKKHLEESLALDENEDGAWFEMGRAFGLEGDSSLEIHAYERAIEINSEDAEYHFNAAVAYDKSGREDAARKTFEHAKAAIRLNAEYKRKFQVVLKNSEVNRQIAEIVRDIIEKTESEILTDEETQKYAENIQNMLGEKLDADDFRDKDKMKELLNSRPELQRGIEANGGRSTDDTANGWSRRDYSHMKAMPMASPTPEPGNWSVTTPSQTASVRGTTISHRSVPPPAAMPTPAPTAYEANWSTSADINDSASRVDTSSLPDGGKVYSDKATRMTRDERDRLMASMGKFTAPAGDLTDAEKRELVLTTIPPQVEDAFNTRMQQLRNWVAALKQRRVELGELEKIDVRLQKMYYTNRVRAVALLEKALRSLAELDGIPVPATPPTLTTQPASPAPPAPSASPAPVETVSMDTAWRGLRAQVASVRAQVRWLRGKVEGVDRLLGGAAPEDLPPSVEAVRLFPAIIQGGDLARIGLTLRHSGAEPPRLRWRCREGRFVHTEGGAAIWKAPWVPGTYTLEVVLHPAKGEPIRESFEVEVYQPGKISYSAELLDARVSMLDHSLRQLHDEYAKLEGRLDPSRSLPASAEFLAGLPSQVPMVRPEMPGVMDLTFPAGTTLHLDPVEGSTEARTEKAGAHRWYPPRESYSVLEARQAPQGPYRWISWIPSLD